MLVVAVTGLVGATWRSRPAAGVHGPIGPVSGVSGVHRAALGLRGSTVCADDEAGTHTRVHDRRVTGRAPVDSTT